MYQQIPAARSVTKQQATLTGNGSEMSFKAADFTWERGGPSRRPLVIHRLNIIFEGTFTIATTAVDALDVWRMVRNIMLVQADGVKRVNGVDGWAMKPAMREKAGGGWKVIEHNDLSAATYTNKRLKFPIELWGQGQYAPRDLSLPTELFGELTFEGAATGTTGICAAGGTLTITAASWTVEAEMKEVDYIPWNPTDEIRVVKFGQNTDAPISCGVGGARIASVLLMRPCSGGTGGGSLTLADLTSVHIEGIYQAGKYKTRAELIDAYAQSIGEEPGAIATDPGIFVSANQLTAGGVLPILWTTPDFRVHRGPVLNSFLVRTQQASALSDLVAVVRLVKPRNPELGAFWEKVYKGTPISWTVRTRDRTRRRLTDWAQNELDYLPLKANLSAARRQG